MNTIFCGTPDIAVPALRLLAARTTVTCVITQPDRPAGRGNKLTPPAMKQAAQALGLPVWQPETLKGQAGDPRFAGLDLAVVMAYGEILRRDVLDRPAQGCINLHASLLPKYRGASPLQAAIRAGDTTTGVTVMRMVRGLDAGAMYLAEEVPIGPRTTLGELHDAMAQAAAAALGRFLDAPKLVPVEQDPALVSHCRKLTSEDGRLDFTVDAVDLDRWVRAYTPAPGCWVPLGSERLKILSVEPLLDSDLAVGVVHQTNDRIRVGCGRGSVLVTRLQAPGGKALAAADFSRGHRLPERF